MNMKTKARICAFVISVILTGLAIFLYSWMLGTNFTEPPHFDIIRSSDMRTGKNTNSNLTQLVDLPFISENTMINILWINKPAIWINLDTINHGLAITCPYKNCRMTEDTFSNKKHYSAIVFSAQDSLTTKINPEHKPRDQVWVFLRMEPPTIAKVSWVNDPIWRNTMNWSWGYRFDSDVFRPVQTLVTRETLPKRNYRKIFQTKTKVAAWAVSNCKTQGRREEYVEQLIRYGVPVDVFGRCSRDKTKIDGISLDAIINKHYKFYLAFESSFCTDYVTEKFFSNFDLDLIVIVRGGINYTQHFDGTTFINAADFKSAKELANYILLLNSNEELYTNYLKRKDKYKAKPIPEVKLEASCRLCEKLNNKENNYNLYENINDYIFKDTCYQPTDL